MTIIENGGGSLPLRQAANGNTFTRHPLGEGNNQASLIVQFDINRFAIEWPPGPVSGDMP